MANKPHEFTVEMVVSGSSSVAISCPATVAAGTLTAGPVVLFGLLVIPPIAARPLARTMGGFQVLASLLGILSAALGVYGAFEVDLPLGPCVVLAAGLLSLPSWLLNLLR